LPMTTYQLASPVDAVQYRLNDNEQEVFDLIKGDRRPSFSNQNGVLRVYNDGVSATVEDGQWVVRLGTGYLLFDSADFHRIFSEAP
jgi:hypothetical protein